MNHFPLRHLDRTSIQLIGQINPGMDHVQVRGVVISMETLGERRAKRLVVYLRGTKESPKVPMEVLATHKKQEVKTEKPKVAEKPKATKKVFVEKKKPVVQKVKFKNGKKKND